MYSTDISIISILIAAVSAMFIGFLWYGPIFGKQWMKLMKITPKDMAKSKDQMPIMYLQMLGLAIIQAFVLDTFVSLARFNSATIDIPLKTAMTAAFLLWLGFIAVIKYHDVIFEGKRKKLFAIDAGYQLVNMIAMALIVTIW